MQLSTADLGDIGQALSCSICVLLELRAIGSWWQICVCQPGISIAPHLIRLKSTTGNIMSNLQVTTLQGPVHGLVFWQL